MWATTLKRRKETLQHTSWTTKRYIEHHPNGVFAHLKLGEDLCVAYLKASGLEKWEEHVRNLNNIIN